jgi:DNA-binding transcriptional MerR regulator
MSVKILSLFDDEPIDPSSLAAGKRKKSASKKAPPQLPETKNIEVQQADQIQNKVVTTEKTPSVKKTPSIDDIIVETLEKQYYTIGETAKKFKVNTSHIRFWTQQFNLKVRTNRKGDRLYSPYNIKQLLEIHQLVKIEGFTITGAKAKLKAMKHQPIVKSANNPEKMASLLPIHQFKDQLLTLKSLLVHLKQYI